MLKNDTEKIRIKKFNYKNLKILVSVIILIFICIVALDNYFYQRIVTFNISETFTQTPIKSQSDIKTELLETPSTITINGVVTKKVNPAIITEGFFNYSYLYEFHGIVKIDTLVLNFEEVPLVATKLMLNDDFVLFASPLKPYTVKLNDQVYQLQITMHRDLEYKLFHLQLAFFNDHNDIVALYNYEF